MEPQVLQPLIPIFALAIPLAGIVFYGLQRLARTRLEEARLREGGLEKSAETDLTALRDEVGELRRELSEMQERMDFAERLLTQVRDHQRLQ